MKALKKLKPWQIALIGVGAGVGAYYLYDKSQDKKDAARPQGFALSQDLKYDYNKMTAKKV